MAGPPTIWWKDGAPVAEFVGGTPHDVDCPDCPCGPGRVVNCRFGETEICRAYEFYGLTFPYPATLRPDIHPPDPELHNECCEIRYSGTLVLEYLSAGIQNCCWGYFNTGQCEAILPGSPYTTGCQACIVLDEIDPPTAMWQLVFWLGPEPNGGNTVALYRSDSFAIPSDFCASPCLLNKLPSTNIDDCELPDTLTIGPL